MNMPSRDPLTGLNKVLGYTPRPHLSRERARPFVKWAGGKRALVPEIAKALPETFGTYWEPFLGGGAAFFALDSRITKAELSDANVELIITYQMVKTKCDELIAALREHATQHSRSHYRRVRDKQHGEQDPVLLASRFIYLNKTCFNGLYRVNKAGRFNVPIGRHKNPAISGAENLAAAAEVLSKARLRVLSFEKIAPQPDDVIYCDPPYDGTFTGYTGTGFSDDDQTALRDCCKKWREAGAHVIISNSDTEFVHDLYKDFTVRKVHSVRSINSDANGRGRTAELLLIG